MNRRLAVFVLMLGLSLPALAGCSLTGTWQAVQAPPGSPLYIRQADFKSDGTYIATAKRGQEDLKLEGKYSFNGMELKLSTPGKPERQYKASLWWNNKLELTSPEGHKETLERK